MKTDKNTYQSNELTVTYDPQLCIHAGKCCAELSEVFRSSVIPWIQLDGASSESIVRQIKKCPSGALSFQKNGKLVAVK